MEDISPHLREPVDDRFDTAVTMHVEAAAGGMDAVGNGTVVTDVELEEIGRAV